MECKHTLEVVDDTRGSDRLGQDTSLTLDSPGDKGLSLADLALGSDLLDLLVIQDTGHAVLVVAERRVSLDKDVLLLQVSSELGLLEVRVGLDLVDSGDDLAVGEEALKALLGEVRNTDGADLALLDKSLHRLPGILELGLLVESNAAGVRVLDPEALADIGAGLEGNGPVDEVQVEVVSLQLLQGLVAGGLDELWLVGGVPELGGKEDLLTGDTRGLPATANFLLVLVASGTIDVAVAVLESDLNGLLDLIRLREL